MAYTKKDAYDYINRYQKENYDRITILRKSGEKERLTQIAKSNGYKTLTEFINACIDEKISSGLTYLQRETDDK